LLLSFDVNGAERNYSSLSAGERLRVNLVILFALHNVLEVLGVKTPNVIVLDELLGVFDAEGLSFVERLLKLQQNKSIYLINHNLDLSGFSGRLDIIKENKISICKETL
jgi:energy-coupling factor transporter ATP-binding protein EcfA2